MNTKQYNEAVNNYADRLLRFVVKSNGNRAEAEDIVQDVFEKLWTKRNKINNENIKSLLFKMAHNQMIDQYRYNKVRRLQITNRQNESTDKEIKRIETKDMLENAFGKLSDQYRKLIMLRDYEGYNYEEIAKITDLSLSQVKVYLFRARKEMQQQIHSLHVKAQC